jgi:hypothetical protein
VLIPALLLACGTVDEPAVRGVRPPPPTPEEIAEKREREDLRTSPRNLEVNYVKPDGVYVDAHFLGGRRWDNVRTIILDQMGALESQSTDARGHEVKQLERGTITLEDGEIDEVIVLLPEPMRREQAMIVCGFSGLAYRYLSFTREYRVNQFQGFRRIILHRAAPNDDLVVKLTAQKKQTRIQELP